MGGEERGKEMRGERGREGQGGRERGKERGLEKGGMERGRVGEDAMKEI